MTQKDLGIYFNWSCNQLAGNPIACDAYLRENLDVIKRVACNLLHDIGYYPQTIYRGILMKESGLTELKPHNGFTYICFSEDIKVAEIFADKNHFMAWGVRMRYGNDLYGYITEYKPQIGEILFHYKFLDFFPYVEAQLHVSNVDLSTIHEQKEVTILQPNHSLILKPFYANTIVYK